MATTRLQHAYDAFEAAYGHLCDLSARALADGVSPEAVRESFLGRDTLYRRREARACAEIHAARKRTNQRSALVRHHAQQADVPKREAIHEMIKLARTVKAAAEAEWMTTIPTSDPNP